MCAIQSNRSSRAGALRIEPVDNWHSAWKRVLKSIDRYGAMKKLSIDADGWLSARQVLLVAFVDDVPAAHVCFSVSPSKIGCIEARLDSHGIEPKFAGRGIESQLHRAATERANALGCESLKGFRFNSKWC
jgi:GNAT superfamily N-acetyltransferase